MEPSHATSTAAQRSSFLARILATVLRHHLTWVHTLIPETTSESESSPTTTTTTTQILGKRAAGWTRSLNATTPYDPLWAQLSDLYGGIPGRLVRTVVVGQNKGVCERLLNVLSYFIRCGAPTTTTRTTNRTSSIEESNRSRLVF